MNNRLWKALLSFFTFIKMKYCVITIYINALKIHKTDSVTNIEWKYITWHKICCYKKNNKNNKIVISNNVISISPLYTFIRFLVDIKMANKYKKYFRASSIKTINFLTNISTLYVIIWFSQEKIKYN